MKTLNGAIIKPPKDHSHEAYPEKAQANIIKTELKKRIKETGASTKEVLESMLTEVSDEVLAHMPKISSLKRSLRRNNDILPNRKE